MPKGGMRLGAGRPGWKPKAERLYSLDIRKLKRDGLLVPGVRVDLNWSQYGKIIGAASATYCENQYLLLRNGSWSQRINLESTPCHLGGSRHWFLCQGCGKRCAVVYLRGNSFECRACHGVAYSSQSEDYIGRLWRKQNKLQAKLKGGWGRPKGMHKQTHRRIFEGIQDCEERREDAIAVFIRGAFGVGGW